MSSLSNNKNIPRDKDIRKAFVNSNIKMFEQENCFFVSEYGLNKKNIIDLAFFDFNKNIIYGFEIKSGVDSLNRLEKQLNAYTNMFNIVYIICSFRHVEHTLELLKSKNYGNNVGIISVDDELNFKEVKKAKYYKPFFHDFIRNLDYEELQLLCESKSIPVYYSNKQKLIGALKLRVDYNELLGALKNKLLKFYNKSCLNCGSRLHFNKTLSSGKESICFRCGSIIPNLDTIGL